MKVLTNQTYKTESGRDLKFDMFYPDVQKTDGCIIVIHGGGWVSGEKEDMHPIAESFAQSGITCACVEYRLAPLHTYPAAVRDCQSLVEYLRLHAEELQIHPDKIGAFGNSAGGHLSSSLAVRDDLEGLKTSVRVNCAVDISGLVDLTNPKEQFPEIAWDFLGQFMGVPFEGNEQLWADASPLFHINEHASPILIFHGECDDVVYPDQSQRFYELLKTSGIKTDLKILKGEWHSFSPNAFDSIMNESKDFFLECFEK